MSATEAAAQLEQATGRYLRLHQEAYGSVLLKPKHHWLLDIPAQLRRDGMVLDAFVIERQHLMVKGVAEHVRNTADYEVSVCSSVLSLQLQETDDDALFDGLIGRTSRLEGFPKAVVANSLTCGCTVIRVGELITRSPDAGFVVACALEGTALFVIVAVTVKVADVTPTAVRLRRTEQLAFWRADEVRATLGWRPEADGTMLLLHM